MKQALKICGPSCHFVTLFPPQRWEPSPEDPRPFLSLCALWWCPLPCQGCRGRRGRKNNIEIVQLHSIKRSLLILTPKVATIAKKWMGCFKETLTDADNFVIDYKQNVNLSTKVLVFAATFLIDMMYFEMNNWCFSSHNLCFSISHLYNLSALSGKPKLSWNYNNILMTVTRPTIPNLYLILCPEDLFLSHTLRGILWTDLWRTALFCFCHSMTYHLYQHVIQLLFYHLFKHTVKINIEMTKHNTSILESQS